MRPSNPLIRLFKRVFAVIVFLGLSHASFAQEEIRAFFEEIDLSKRVYNVTFSGVEKVETLIVETDDIREGVYDVSVTRVDYNLYKIEGTKYYIEMPYCYRYAMREDAVMTVRTFIGRKVGTLDFDQ